MTEIIRIKNEERNTSFKMLISMSFDDSHKVGGLEEFGHVRNKSDFDNEMLKKQRKFSQKSYLQMFNSIKSKKESFVKNTKRNKLQSLDLEVLFDDVTCERLVDVILENDFCDYFITDYFIMVHYLYLSTDDLLRILFDKAMENSLAFKIIERLLFLVNVNEKLVKKLLRESNVDINQLEIINYIMKDKLKLFASNSQLEKPIISKKLKLVIYENNIDKIAFQLISPLEFARQITIYEQDLLRIIQPSEFLLYSEEYKEKSLNLTTYVEWTNQVTNWVINVILSRSKPKSRGKLIKKFIMAAQKLLELKNYNSFLSICTGLQSFSIRRLEKSWKNVNMEHYKLLEKISSPIKNYRLLRKIYKKSTFPLIPPLIVILRDISLTHWGNQNYNDDEKKLINVDKLIIFGEAILKIFVGKIFETYPYFKVEIIQNYLGNLPLMLQNEVEMEERSILLEKPKNK